MNRFIQQCTLLLCCVLPLTLQGQNAHLGERPSSWWFEIHGGGTAAFAKDSTSRYIRQSYREWNEDETATTELTGRLAPKFGYTFGLKSGFYIGDHLALGLGVQYSQRGFVQKEESAYQNPTYQYDETVTAENAYQINMIDYLVEGRFIANSGFEAMLGANFNTTYTFLGSELRQTYVREVKVNGAADAEESEEDGSIRRLLDGELRGMGINPYAGIRLPLEKKRRVNIQLFYFLISDLFNDEKELGNHQLQLSLSFQLK